MINLDDPLIFGELIENELLSNRSINIIKVCEISTLNEIIEYYNLHRTFKGIRNCGERSEKELVSFCNRYLDLINYDKNNFKDEEVTILEKIDSLSPYQKAILNRHYDLLKNKLSNRSLNGLIIFSENKDTKEVLNSILDRKFNFKNFRNIGNTSYKELNKLLENLIEFINFLIKIPKENLSKEYTKLILKYSFSDLKFDFSEKFENLFDSYGKIRLFSLINIYLDSGKIFNSIEYRIFFYIYQNHFLDLNILEVISKELNLSKERVRQVKSKFTNELENYFLFISTLNTEDISNYLINISNELIVIDTTFAKRINNLEAVQFNAKFYSVIFGILLKKTHSVLGENIFIINSKLNKFQLKNSNYYLISSLLLDCFDFFGFIKDIYSKLNEKVIEDYTLQFHGYLSEFILLDGKIYYIEIYEICNTLLFTEFDLIVNPDGYLIIERNTFKQLHEYCFEILNEASNPMTVEEIDAVFNEKYPFVKKTIDSIRGSLIREKGIFICFGRTSTYALKSWEQEKENFKGGTIKDLVENYLKIHEVPIHINDIVLHVLKFRPKTNVKSIFANIKLDKCNKFHFFKKSFIGLNEKIYSDLIFQEIESPINWEMKFAELKNFYTVNSNTWPSASSKNKKEMELYWLGYRLRKSYKKGTLEKDKENYLRDINFPIDYEKLMYRDWEDNLEKLINFYSAKKKLPSSNSSDKEERALYRFFYINRMAFKKSKLTIVQIKIMEKMNFNFNILK